MQARFKRLRSSSTHAACMHGHAGAAARPAAPAWRLAQLHRQLTGAQLGLLRMQIKGPAVVTKLRFRAHVHLHVHVHGA